MSVIISVVSSASLSSHVKIVGKIKSSLIFSHQIFHNITNKNIKINKKNKEIK